ncbi:response regulator transcription factor [Streptomyces rochei]|uniref:response regulator transcription factor n=1 Tax=Streptomyces TaxID=1883 RepID=UPI0002FEE87D|nr:MULTISPECIES: helix-turn-helix transcriptional regulator [Streptomyces]MBD2817412.1 helix-turn-helix transcriptional regulator [Streptomyces parvulus]MBU8550900.1 helix-turn-helix transcriptional regulator [Streptomyces sp. Osf17]MBU8557681.1 helix-turn-helix transcriptional regulator [Streptomyces sp. Babs14]PVD03986.1 LuxR family transcriptional regulator [Streptomyces sp. CS207]QCB23645.1 LuxR family transcriptional regulator [Streptomyces sp. SS52]
MAVAVQDKAHDISTSGASAGVSAPDVSAPRLSGLDFSALTGRELEVLLLLATGEQNRRLARRLGIAERTVRAHTASIVRKLGLTTRFEAAIVAHLYADDIRGARG